MKKFLQLCLTVITAIFGFSQNLRPIAQKVADFHSKNKNFVKYAPFTVDNAQQKNETYRNAAADITVLQPKTLELQKIVSGKPEALELSFPFEGKELTVDLVKVNIFTDDFKVSTSDGDIFDYKPGVYYQGIVKDDPSSVVAFSFFDNDVVGVSSIKNVGNVVLGKASNSTDYVSYNDVKLKGSNPFVCGTDDLKENKKNKVSFNPNAKNALLTDNCVRVYYEVGYGPYTQNSSNVTTTTNWSTAMFNNVSTLYSNDGVKTALSQVFVWTTSDTSTYSGTPSNILNQFRTKRPTINGDVGQLLRNPATTSIAWVDALCTTYKYSYCGVNQSYSNVPTYSWNIEAMAHEMGHNLASPHTHACAWNGNDTAIDGCGPAAGYDEGCSAALPSSGGTIMSYCHLVSSVGINFANGFGAQPGALIRNRVNSRGCLGTNCTSSCTLTVSQVDITNVTKNSATATITDNTSTSWKYKLAKIDGTVITSGTTTSKTINFTGLSNGTYYIVSVGTTCSGPNAYQTESLLLTDADWCTGLSFTDSGGAASNYANNQYFEKTFYPSSPGQKLKLTFTEFGLESGYDYLDVYDGIDTSAPTFTNGNSLTGSTVPGPFTATNASGAITVTFSADAGVTDIGWNATFQCLGTLATNDAVIKNAVVISPNPVKNKMTISSSEKLVSYKIYDASGKLITSTSKANAEDTVVDMSNLAPGVYNVSVTTEKQTIIKKVIKY